jgi:hypothetical protein
MVMSMSCTNVQTSDSPSLEESLSSEVAGSGDHGTGCGAAEVPSLSVGKHSAGCTMETALYKGKASRSPD